MVSHTVQYETPVQNPLNVLHTIAPYSTVWYYSTVSQVSHIVLHSTYSTVYSAELYKSQRGQISYLHHGSENAICRGTQDPNKERRRSDTLTQYCAVLYCTVLHTTQLTVLYCTVR